MTVTPQAKTTTNPSLVVIEFDGTNAAEIVSWLVTETGSDRGFSETGGDLFFDSISARTEYFEADTALGLTASSSVRVKIGQYIVLPGTYPNNIGMGVMISDATKIASDTVDL